MRVLLAPDCFTGTLTALEAAQALAAGWAAAAPRDDLDLCPLSDGGPGLLEVLRAALPGSTDLPVEVEDPLARPVPASVRPGPGWTNGSGPRRRTRMGSNVVARTTRRRPAVPGERRC